MRAKEQCFFKIFSELRVRNINFIVVRKWERPLEEFSIVDDMDILCKRADRKKIIDLFRELNFRMHVDSRVDNIYLYGSFPHDHFTNEYYDVHVDIVYNLAYRSINAGEWIPAHEDIQHSIWQNAIPHDEWDGVVVPSNLDELVHIIPHCIFDKKAFVPYYKERISLLIKRVEVRPLERLLAFLFFKFSPTLLQLIRENNFQDIVQRYIAFKNY